MFQNILKCIYFSSTLCLYLTLIFRFHFYKDFLEDSIFLNSVNYFWILYYTNYVNPFATCYILLGGRKFKFFIYHHLCNIEEAFPLDFVVIPKHLLQNYRNIGEMFLRYSQYSYSGSWKKDCMDIFHQNYPSSKG